MPETQLPQRCEVCGCAKLCTENLSLFRELPMAVQERLTAQAVSTHHVRGSRLFQQGDPIDEIRIIRRGQVKLCRFDTDGREYILDVLSAGNSIWEGIFRPGAEFVYDGVCLTDVELCEVRRPVFLAEIAGKPEVASYLIGLLSIRLAEAQEKALLLTIRDPRVRMAGFLLDRDRRWPGPEINLKLEEIAASIGLREETVSRVLRGFEKSGIIERMGKGKIRLRDRDMLREISEGGRA
ncbi:Crp/Fnr family transcriptional regulator [Clostridium vitabionis]|uniref:Crp/Fnr family transcriptional regulator n=1 Tax=Clostridium vitabionis TaxID=2784388 RepID=UPI00188BD5AD|nr:Crp/Fnr family transcriptional regulator [Clostridium vitabionis]